MRSIGCIAWGWRSWDGWDVKVVMIRSRFVPLPLYTRLLLVVTPSAYGNVLDAGRLLPSG